MKKAIIRVAACQTPDIRQDLDGALAWIETYGEKAGAEAVSLLCFPECFIQGYLVEEMHARRHAVNLASPAFEAVLKRLTNVNPTLVFGLIEVDRGQLYNTAVVVDRGLLVGSYRKTHLLDGETIFSAGNSHPVFDTAALRFGIAICYDTNFSEATAAPAAQHTDLIICPANNMMRHKKAEEWKYRHNEIRAKRAKETGCWIVSSDVTGERNDISH